MLDKLFKPELMISAACWCCLVLIACKAASSTATEFKIGAIYEQSDQLNPLAFQLAVRSANAMLKSWRRSTAGGAPIRLEPLLRVVPDGDYLTAGQEVCRLLSLGVVALAGPAHRPGSVHAVVHSQAGLHAVPHVFVSPGVWNSEAGHHFTVNLHPSYASLGRAVLSLVRRQIEENEPNSFRFAIVYSDREALLKYEPLLNSVREPTLIRQWRRQSGTYEYVMKYFNKLAQFNFLVDIPADQLMEFFQTAHRLNMTREYYNYYLTTWDADRIDYRKLAPYFDGANVTSFSLVPRQLPTAPNRETEEFVARVIDKQLQMAPFMDQFIPTEPALLYDALHMLALGLLAASQSKDIKPQPLNCHSRDLWSDGATVMNYVTAVRDGQSSAVEQLLGGKLNGAKFQPFSGPISLDSDGFRSDYQLVLEERLPYQGSHQFGYWTEKGGLVVIRNYTQTKEEIRETLRGKTLYVTTIIEEPFVLYSKPLRPGEEPEPNPDLWDGFCVDLLKNMSGRLGFNISMRRVRDNQYGKIVSSDPDGKEIWNGMIGELMNKTADLAIASLTITYDRERVIDFTTPFMSLGLSIIYKKPQKEKPSLFSFLYPLSPTVWAYMLAAYLIVSFALFTVARFSPFEWHNPSSCNAESNVVENQFSLANSFWFTIGSLMQQGSEMAPRANSTRIVAGSWWFFTLIMISSYTANLAAFLTVKRMKSPIENVEDLSKQKEINYGILESGSTFRFFQKATIPTYKSMYEYMSANAAKSFVKSTQQGIERVLNENYAFILESTMNEYYAQRNCQLMQVGGLLDSKGYGIGMPEGSPYVDIFSETILELQKNQTLEYLRKYWFRDHNISRPCDDIDSPSSNRHVTNSLGLEQIGGAFVILTIGMLLSIACGCLEFCFRHARVASAPIANQPERRSLCNRICSELQFAVQCCVSSKRQSQEHQPAQYSSSNQQQQRMLQPSSKLQSATVRHLRQHSLGAADLSEIGERLAIQELNQRNRLSGLYIGMPRAETCCTTADSIWSQPDPDADIGGPPEYGLAVRRSSSSQLYQTVQPRQVRPASFRRQRCEPVSTQL